LGWQELIPATALLMSAYSCQAISLPSFSFPPASCSFFKAAYPKADLFFLGISSERLSSNIYLVLLKGIILRTTVSSQPLFKPGVNFSKDPGKKYPKSNTKFLSPTWHKPLSQITTIIPVLGFLAEVKDVSI